MFVSLLLRWRTLVLMAWLLGIVLALSAFAVRLAGNTPWVDNSVGIWFKTDDPELVAYEAHNAAFGEQEWTLLLLETDSIFDAGFLRDLSRITARIEALDHVVKVTSITNVRDNDLSEDGDLNYATLYPAGTDRAATDEELTALRQRLHRNPVFHNNLLRTDSNQYTVVLIQNDNLIHDPTPYRITLIDNISDIVKDYDTISDSAIAGTTVVNAELNRASKHDVIVFYLSISALLVLFTLLVLKNWRDLVALLAVVIGSVLPTMGLIAYCRLPFNMMTVMLPTIMLALGVAGVIHVINTFHRLHQDHDAETALQKTLGIVFRPGLYAMVTTSAGFASLTLSNVTPVFQLGLFAALGIVLAWLLSITVVPVLLHSLWLTRHKPLMDSHGQHRLQGLAKPCSGRTFWVAIIGIAVPLGGLTLLETDTNYSEFFSDNTPVSKAYEKIDAAGFAQNPINISLVYPESMTYAEAPYFEAVIRFEEAIAQLPQVIKVLSPNALVTEIDKAFNGHSAPGQLSTYNVEEISQLLFLGELSGNDDLSDLLAADQSRSQLLALTAYMSSKELDRFRDDVLTLARQHLPPDLHVYLTGTSILWANMDRHVSTTQIQSLLAMAVLLSLTLLFVFRSIKLTLIGLLVNGLPLGIVLGLMGLLNVNINLATSLIGGITLGIVVDDSLHLLMRIRDNLGHGREHAIATAIDDVGRSILHTTLIIVGGFACMMTSDFSPSAEFGTFVSLAVVLALVLDLWWLPQLLRLMMGREVTSEARFASVP